MLLVLSCCLLDENEVGSDGTKWEVGTRSGKWEVSKRRTPEPTAGLIYVTYFYLLDILLNNSILKPLQKEVRFTICESVFCGLSEPFHIFTEKPFIL